MWDDQFLPLAQGFRVIRYDLRGFGRSALPTDAPYSHGEDLRALLDALGLQQAHLVGLSKGGGVALDFALTYPQRALSLVLIDTVLGGHAWSAEGSARDALVWEAALRQPVVAARLRQIIADYTGWHFVNADPEQGLTPPAAQRLHELRLPVLAMVGEHDLPDFVQIAARIGREVSQARTVVVPGAGHMANMESPAVVTQALRDFLQAAWANRPSLPS